MSEPKEKQPIITRRSLYSWVFYKNSHLQILLLSIILVTVGARIFPLQMQKEIINQAIGLQKIDLLIWYCSLYLGAVVLASVLKFAINALQTYIGQRSLIHMRQQLYEHVISLPLPFFRRTQPGLVISTLISELAAVSEFVGQAVAMPVVNVLTLIGFAGYMFYLEPLLAALSLAIYPFEIIIIPYLQKKANLANRERINITRDASSLVGESISGVHEIHSNASYRLELKKFTDIILKLYTQNVRMQIYRFAVKFANSLFQSFGPFILFLVGGYLAIKGRFDLGALVAFLSAYEKVYDPWKELMDFYQLFQDARVRYHQIMGYFDFEPEYPQTPEDRESYHLEGKVEVRDATYTVPGNIVLLDRVSLVANPGEQVALVGFSGGGKSTLALVIGQLYKYSSGSVLLGGQEIGDLTKQDMANNIGIVAQHPYIFNGTVRENLHYSCQAMAMQPGVDEETYPMPNLDQTIEMIQQVGLFLDVLRFGLRTVIAAEEHQELVKQFIRLRADFQERYGELLARDVEFFDPNTFLYYSSVAVNLLFGDPDKESWKFNQLHQNPDFLSLLDQHQLRVPLLILGEDLARETVDILQNTAPSAALFENTPIPVEEFEEYQALVGRLPKQGSEDKLSAEDQGMLLKLALSFVPNQHNVVSASDSLLTQILRARGQLRKKIDELEPGAIHVYHRSEYMHSQSILENIVFGRIKFDSGGAVDRVNESLMQLLIEENILEQVVAIGLDFQVGSAGDRLSGGQRQKVALARTFLKKPPVLILDEATAALDNASQARIQNILERNWKGKSTLISVVHRLDIVKNYDRIVVLKAGNVLETGPYDELMAQKGALYELVQGSKS